MMGQGMGFRKSGRRRLDRRHGLGGHHGLGGRHGLGGHHRLGGRHGLGRLGERHTLSGQGVEFQAWERRLGGRTMIFLRAFAVKF